MDAEVTVDCDQACVEGGVVGCAGGQPVSGVEALAGGTVFPWLDVSGSEQPSSGDGGTESAEHAPVAAVDQYVLGEDVLSDPGGRQQHPFGLPLLCHRGGQALPVYLVSEFGFERGQ